MAEYDYDLITIGGGSGGVRASRFSAQRYGKKVAVIENLRIGGTCVMRGCVPKKLLVYGSHFSDHFEDAEGFGWSVGESRHDWAKLIAAKTKELNRLEDVYHRLLREAGVDEITGTGKLVDAHTVEVDGKTYTAEHILIATGGWPKLPDVPGIEHAITSNEALDLESLPERIVIVGGGYIAVEFAGIFAGLGAEVTVIIRAENILRGFDQTMREALRDEMAKRGINVLSECQVKSIEKTDSGYSLRLDQVDFLETDLVMYATGRGPNTKGIGLEEVGVEMDKNGAIVVDEYSKTNIDNIYAIGDVTDRIQLTPVALAEGMAFARTVFAGEPTSMSYENVPSAVFSQPPIGTVGLTEADARKDHDVLIFQSRFRPMKHTLSGRDEHSVMKLIVDKKTDRVLGAHMIGDDAPEIIQGIGIAVKAGATKADFDATIGIHPTAAEEFVTMREPLRDEED
ncbi:MAG: glutathione-disulfide reductase [Rhodospirillales bacterium]|nr:glutathione-disulfide reductase [Rhodospirillales bacterium]